MPPEQSTPVLDVSLVIPTRDRHDLLRNNLRSVAAGRAVPAEIIIVDQSREPSSGIETLPMPPGVRLRHVMSSGSGLSRGRNEGFEHASFPLVAMIDDDVEVSEGWLDALVGALVAAGPRAAVTGRVLPGPTPTGQEYVPSVNVATEPATFVGLLSHDVLFGNNFAIPRAAIAEVGGFDVRLGPGAHWSNADDNDFGYRLLTAGYAIHFVPEAALTHLAWRSGRDLLRLRWSYGRGQGGFYAKHTSMRDRHLLHRLLRDCRLSAGEAARFGLRLDPWAAMHLAHLAGLLSGFAEWILTRPTAADADDSRPSGRS